MKRTIFSLLVLCLIAFSANGQKRLGFGLMNAAPVGDFGDANSIGIGFGVSGETFISEKLSLGLSIGYTNFSGKEDGIDFPSVSIAPLAIYGNYHFNPGSPLDIYVGVGIGYGIASIRPDQGDNISGNGIMPNTRVGINLMLSETFGLDANVGYNIFKPTFDGFDESSDLNNLPLNIGVFYIMQ